VRRSQRRSASPLQFLSIWAAATNRCRLYDFIQLPIATEPSGGSWRRNRLP
jgi:hypothetical protein